MYSPEALPVAPKSGLPELDASLAEAKGVAAAQGRVDERDYLDGLVAAEADRVAKAEAALLGENNALAESERLDEQNEGLKEVQAEAEAIEAKIAAMKAERPKWDWNNLPALVSALGKMAKIDPGFVGELEDAMKALGLVTDLARVRKQIDFVRTAQSAPATEIKH